MDSQDLLIAEIKRNCDLALLAYTDIEKHLQSIKWQDKETLDRFWLSVLSYLIVVANISKILWPSESNIKGPKGAEISSRREALRRRVSIDDSSIIARRTFRNYFEHYDFRIEETIESKVALIIDSNILPIDLLRGIDSSQMALMRNFDPQTFILYFRDDHHPIKESMKEISELSEKINTIVK
jgi:hypothetical protein